MTVAFFRWSPAGPAGSVRTPDMRRKTHQRAPEIAPAVVGLQQNRGFYSLAGQGAYDAVHASVAEMMRTSNCS